MTPITSVIKIRCCFPFQMPSPTADNSQKDAYKKSKNVEKMSNDVENMSTNLENQQILVKEDLDTESKNCERTKRRAPKLSALRAATNGTFSKPLVMTRLDDSIKRYNLYLLRVNFI